MANKTKKTEPNKNGIKLICENRKAHFEYSFEEKFEGGLVLTGSEVKSLRGGKANITDAYLSIKSSEAFLMQAHIQPYEKGGYANHEPKRIRKVLLHKKEIESLYGKSQIKGMSLIPLKLYFKNSKVKVEIGLGKGKKLHDKRETVKERDSKRELDRAIKKFR